MGATIRKRTTGKLDKFGNPVVSYQVRWREPVRDEFGAPAGQFKQTSETFDTERKAKAHLRKVEDQLDSGRGVDPSSQKAKANRPLGEYAKQYIDSLAGTIDDSTIASYAKIYRTHIGPVFGSKPVASITTADVRPGWPRWSDDDDWHWLAERPPRSPGGAPAGHPRYPRLIQDALPGEGR